MGFDILTWEDVSFSYNTSKGLRQAKYTLKSCTGYLKGGDMLAVIGPHEPGKTTLLKILARRILPCTLEGRAPVILINGANMSNDAFFPMHRFFEQYDMLLHTMSVEEVVSFYANLRFGPLVPDGDKKKKTDELLRQVGLASQLRCRVSRLSAGEKRCLSLTCLAFGDPQILLFDEPTRGLNRYEALHVVANLNKFSEQGRLVAFTMDQPNAEIWDLFTKVLFLSDGHTVFFGDTAEVIAWFSSKLHLSMRPNISIPEWVLSVIGSSSTKGENEAKIEEGSWLIDGERAGQIWDFGDKASVIQQVIAQSKTDNFRNSLASDLPEEEIAFAFFWMYALRIMMKRSIIHCIRNPQNFRDRIAKSILLTALHCILFWRFSKPRIDVVGMFIVLEYFLLCVGFVMIVSFLSLPIFMEDRAIFQHESAMRLYPTFTYFISGLLCEVFVTTLQISLFGIMTYLSCYPTDRYQIKEAVIYVGVLIITACSSSSLAMVSVVTSTTLPRTLSTHGALTGVAILFSGLLNSYPKMLPWLRSLQWISFAKYALAILVLDRFKGDSWEFLPKSMDLKKPDSITTNFYICLGFFLFFSLMSYYGHIRIAAKTHLV